MVAGDEAIAGGRRFRHEGMEPPVSLSDAAGAVYGPGDLLVFVSNALCPVEGVFRNGLHQGARQKVPCAAMGCVFGIAYPAGDAPLRVLSPGLGVGKGLEPGKGAVGVIIAFEEAVPVRLLQGAAKGGLHFLRQAMVGVGGIQAPNIRLAAGRVSPHEKGVLHSLRQVGEPSFAAGLPFELAFLAPRSPGFAVRVFMAGAYEHEQADMVFLFHCTL